jgi:molybdenum cofactor cytidylyltransferase
MGRPKALLEYRGETFVGRLARVLGAHCDVVVVGSAFQAAAGFPAGVRTVVNFAPERGQLSSLQTALATLPPDIEGFLFTPVDSPAADESTVARIIAEFRRANPLVVIPRHNGRKGHPVCASPEIAAELLAMPPTGSAREVIRRHADRTLFLDTEDAGILADVDDPEAYRQLIGATP